METTKATCDEQAITFPPVSVIVTAPGDPVCRGRFGLPLGRLGKAAARSVLVTGGAGAAWAVTRRVARAKSESGAMLIREMETKRARQWTGALR